MGLVERRQVRSAENGFYAHQPHQALHPLMVRLIALPLQELGHFTVAVKRSLQVLLV